MYHSTIFCELEQDAKPVLGILVFRSNCLREISEHVHMQNRGGGLTRPFCAPVSLSFTTVNDERCMGMDTRSKHSTRQSPRGMDLIVPMDL